MTSTILFVGDVGVDVTLRLDHVPQPDEKVVATAAIRSVGGVTANATVAASLAGATTQAAFRVGNDPDGIWIQQEVGRWTTVVDITVGTGTTCTALILLEPHGEKRLVLTPGISMYPSADTVSSINLSGIAWVHTAVYDPRAASRLIDRCRSRHIPWSLDLEPATFAHGFESLADHLAGAEVVFCNARAAALLGPQPVPRLMALGAKSVILTLGAAGAKWFQQGHRPVPVHSSPQYGTLRVVDTTGAGDCLAGWYVAERVHGCTPIIALEAAVAAATLSCTEAGAQPSFPTRDHVTDALANGLMAVVPVRARYERQQRRCVV